MQNILYNISQVLGITIIHSLWQGLLVYFILKVVLLMAINLSSAKKYLLALSSLLAITLWFAYTLVNEIQLYDWLAKPQSIANMLLLELPANLRHFNDATTRYYYSIEGYLPYITVLYVTGLLLNTGRLVLSRKKISHIKQTMSLAVHLQQQIGSFAKKLNITKKVKVGFSHLVDVPCITGYLKPVILLPITLSTYLEAEEIEAILMHELAHIKRNDYVINLLQQVITTLLFFNPCVLLINKIIGQERENSCDDLVVNSTQMPVAYAKALFKLEQNRQNELQLALAVTGKKYHLLNRIERIMKTKKQTTSIRPTLVAMLVLSLSVGSLALLNPEIAEGKISVKIAKPVIDKLLTDTVPAHAAKSQAKAVKATAKANKNKARLAHTNRSADMVYFPGIKDPELDRLSADVQKHADVIEKYYNSPDFKTQSDEMDRLGKEVDAFYNSDKIKQLTAEQEKSAAEYEKLMNGKSAGMEQYGKQMEDLGKQIDKYFNSPEFKEMNAALEKKYGITHNSNHNSRDENYRKYQDELESKLSPQIKQQTQQMKKLGEQMRSVYASPEMRAQTDRMRAMGDSLRRAFNNPAVKQQQEQMRKVGDRMRNFTNNEQIRKQQKLLNEATTRLRAYIKSPEFKKKMQEYRKTARAYNYHFDNHNDLNEKPELPEVPEAPEAPEAPETDF